MADLSLGTLYEVNQNIISQQKPMDPILVNRKLAYISDLVADGYWMLMCPEVRQYVVLHIDNPDNTYPVLREILSNRGIVIDIDSTNENDLIWEFWIKDIYDGVIRMYQLTPYEVVEV